MQVDDLAEQTLTMSLHEAQVIRPEDTDGTYSPIIPNRVVGLRYLWQNARPQLLIGITDLIVITASMCVAFMAVVWIGKTANHFPTFLSCVAFAHLFAFWGVDLNPGIGLHPAEAMRRYVCTTLMVSLALLLSLLLVSSPSSAYVWMLLLAAPLQMMLLPLGRLCCQSLMNRLGISIPFYFLGSRQNTLQAFHMMGLFGRHLLQPVGRFVFEHSQESRNNEFDDLDLDEELELRFERTAAYKGTIEDLITTAKRENVYWLIVAEGQDRAISRKERSSLQKLFPQVITVKCPFSENAMDDVATYGALKGIRAETKLLLPWNRLIKRLLDVSCVLIALPLVLPLALLIVAIIKLTSPGAAFFFHERIGKNGVPFRAWKFRTMVANAQQVLEQCLANDPALREEWNRDHKLKNDPRITWIGRLLRKTSLDELPQLWNVVTGEMSLVGPRPIVTAEIPKYAETFQEYIRVTPGITGLWQISGRNNTTYGERLQLDRYYVRNWSPWLDLYILLRTIKTVLFCEGAY